MGYDPATGTVILFGGYSSLYGVYGDTWSWNGSNWTELHPATSPSPSTPYAQATYDPSIQRIVLFGGGLPSCCNNLFTNDTWTWNGTNWAKLHPVTSPPPQGQGAMTYDATNHEIILFGGQYGQYANGAYLDTTWIFNGTTWVKPSAPPPPPKQHPTIDLTPASGPTGTTISVTGSGFGDYRAIDIYFDIREIVLTVTSGGGRFAVTSVIPAGANPGRHEITTVQRGAGLAAQTTFTVTTTGSSVPIGRSDASFAYYPPSHTPIMFGGHTSGGGPNLDDTWTWDGASWAQLSPATSPAPRFGAAEVFDAASHQLLLFGGSNSSFSYGDTWAWNGSNWTQLYPATSPSVRDNASIAYDPVHKDVLLFGGANYSDYLDDTSIWNGSNWIQQHPRSSPPGRNAAYMTYDVGSRSVVLFGGYSDATGNLSDTCTWNGTNWIELHPTLSPSPRNSTEQAEYDDATREMVIFGGASVDEPFLEDTWTWDGKNWTEAHPTLNPGAQAYGSMTYDSARRQAVLFGGSNSSTPALDTTWISTDTNWKKAQLP
jgi:hypothetical protein